MRYNSMVSKYSVQDILLITTLTNFYIGSSKGEMVYLPILKDSYDLTFIYSKCLREIKNFSFSEIVIEDTFIQWGRHYEQVY
jgi:hypothetical protein